MVDIIEHLEKELPRKLGPRWERVRLPSGVWVLAPVDDQAAERLDRREDGQLVRST